MPVFWVQVKDEPSFFNNENMGGSSIWVNTAVTLHYSSHNLYNRSEKCNKPKVSTVGEQQCQSSLKAVDKHHTYSTALLSNCSPATGLYHMINASYFTVLTWHLKVEYLHEWWIGREIKENRNGLLQGNITAFTWRHWEKPPKISVTLELHAIS